MNTNWRWISKPALVLLHHESLAEHGGAEGVRDDGLLDSALARHLNILAGSDPAAPPDVATLAASDGVGLAKNQAFVDGNKRCIFGCRRQARPRASVIIPCARGAARSGG